MGVRVYLPTVGRFTSQDPIEGGTDNAYVYVNDPVNDFDLSGAIGWKKWFKSRWSNIKTGGRWSIDCTKRIANYYKDYYSDRDNQIGVALMFVGGIKAGGKGRGGKAKTIT